jgi:hypothetical protein
MFLRFVFLFFALNARFLRLERFGVLRSSSFENFQDFSRIGKSSRMIQSSKNFKDGLTVQSGSWSREFGLVSLA